jgi:hypothetical protein
LLLASQKREAHHVAATGPSVISPFLRVHVSVAPQPATKRKKEEKLMPLVGFYYLWIHFIIMSHRFEFIHRRLFFVVFAVQDIG